MSRPALHHWSSAEFVEARVLPALFAFALGFVFAMLATEHRLDTRLAEATQRAQQARKTAERAQALTNHYAQACGPLLSWPIESTPMVLSGTGSLAQRGQP